MGWLFDIDFIIRPLSQHTKVILALNIQCLPLQSKVSEFDIAHAITVKFLGRSIRLLTTHWSGIYYCTASQLHTMSPDWHAEALATRGSFHAEHDVGHSL